MANGNGAGADLEKMREKILAIGSKFEKVQVRRTKSGPIDPFALKLLLLNRELFGGLQDIVLEFFTWLNQVKYCFLDTAVEFFTKSGLASTEANLLLVFLIETGFIMQYVFPTGENVIGMDLGADAVIRAIGQKSNFGILPSKEILQLASYAIVRKQNNKAKGGHLDHP